MNCILPTQKDAASNLGRFTLGGSFVRLPVESVGQFSDHARLAQNPPGGLWDY
jgi:hypothetical protein